MMAYQLLSLNHLLCEEGFFVGIHKPARPQLESQNNVFVVLCVCMFLSLRFVGKKVEKYSLYVLVCETEFI